MFVLTHPAERLALQLLAPLPDVEAAVYVTVVDLKNGVEKRANVHLHSDNGAMVTVMESIPAGQVRTMERFLIHNRGDTPITMRLFFRGHDSVEDLVLQRVVPAHSTLFYGPTGWDVIVEDLSGTIGSVLIFGADSVGASGGETRFLYPGYNGQLAKPTSFGLLAPRNGTLRGLHVRHNDDVGNGSPVVYTVRINGADTLLSCSVDTGAFGTGSDTANSVLVTAGQLIEVSASKAAALGNGAVQPVASMQYTA